MSYDMLLTLLTLLSYSNTKCQTFRILSSDIKTDIDKNFWTLKFSKYFNSNLTEKFQGPFQ